MSSSLEPVYRYRAEIVKIVDGDTIIMNIDLGFNIWVRNCRMRLSGCNAPEIIPYKGEPNSPAYQEWLNSPGCVAKRRLEELINGAKQIIVETQKDHTDKYGRMLALLFVKKQCPKCNGDKVITVGMNKVICECCTGTIWICVNDVLLKEGLVAPFKC